MISTIFTADLYQIFQHRQPSIGQNTLAQAHSWYTHKTIKKVYHGSPVLIDHFHEAKEADNAKMLFGHGLYFTASQSIAERYRLQRSQEGHQSEVRIQTPQGILSLSQAMLMIESIFIDKPIDIERLTSVLTYTVRGKNKYGDLTAAEKIVRHQWEDPSLADAVAVLKKEGFEPLNDGFLYEISLKMDDDKTLVWEQSWGAQSRYIHSRLEELGIVVPMHTTVRDWYDQEKTKSSAKDVSAMLENAGLDGIRYEEPKDPGTFNYVAFSPSQVTIDVVHDNHNRQHIHNANNERYVLADLQEKVLSSQMNKDLRDSIKYRYKKEGIAAQKAIDYTKEEPLLTLLRTNYALGKHGVDLLDGMTVYRGTKNINPSLGSFDAHYIHTTPVFHVAHGYALTTNDDIGFNAEPTKGIGRVTEYTLPENAVFHQNFGLEESHSGLTKSELVKQLLPLLEAYHISPSDATSYPLRQFINSYMYEVGIPPDAEPIASSICLDKVIYPLIPEIEDITAKMVDLNHAALINHGLQMYRKPWDTIEHHDRLEKTAPKQWAQLKALHNEAVQILQMYQQTPIPYSVSLAEAEQKRDETLTMLEVDKIGQSNGRIHFKNHPQLHLLDDLAHQREGIFAEAIEEEKRWCQRMIQSHIQKQQSNEQIYKENRENWSIDYHAHQQTLSNVEVEYSQKSRHVKNLTKRINERESTMESKRGGLFGWWYRIISESKDQAVIEKDKKYRNINTGQLTTLENKRLDIKNTLQSLQEQGEQLESKFLTQKEQLEIEWMELAQQHRSLIAQELGDTLWKPGSLTLDDIRQLKKDSGEHNVSKDFFYAENLSI